MRDSDPELSTAKALDNLAQTLRTASGDLSPQSMTCLNAASEMRFLRNRVVELEGQVNLVERVLAKHEDAIAVQRQIADSLTACVQNLTRMRLKM